MNKNYICMLEESLEKKVDILRRLQILCQEQAEILEDFESDAESFEDNVNQKGVLIEKLANLDQGFDKMLDRVKEELETNKDAYRDSILHMQELIRDITDRSNHIQVMEARNKDLAQKRFGEVRSQAREIRQSGKAVSSYYQSMMRVNTVDPQFMDSKK